MMSLFGIDSRSLALFRIIIGSILLLDLALRFQNLTEHYSDWGALPRWLWADIYVGKGHLCLHAMSGSPIWQCILFLVAAIAAGCLLAGYKTKWATAVSFALLASLHSRNGLILNGGDTFLRIMLFWSMFVPLAKSWSVDNGRGEHGCVVSGGTFAMLLQVCLLYWFAGIFKTHGCWTIERNALAMAFTVDQTTSDVGRWLLNYPEVLKWFTIATMHLESWVPCLLWLPYKNHWLRMIGVVVYMGFHAGIGITMLIGLFPWICGVIWVIFIPGEFWTWCFKSMQKTPISFGNPVLDFAITALLLLVLSWNCLTVTREWKSSPKLLLHIVQVCRIDQKWKLFAPRPRTDDGWVVVEGVTKSGQRVDLAHGWPVYHGRPESIAESMGTYRQSRLLRAMFLSKNVRVRKPYVRFLRRNWPDYEFESTAFYVWQEKYDRDAKRIRLKIR